MNKFETMSPKDLEEYFIKSNISSAVNHFQTQLQAITACYEKKYFNPVLILIYSTIDTLSYLDRMKDTESVKSRFTRFVDKFILPNSKLNCNALELYGARCGIVHNSAAKSDLSKTGKVREIYYAHGNKDTLTDLIKRDNKANKIVVLKIPDLFYALYDGVYGYLHWVSEHGDLIKFLDRIQEILTESDKDALEIMDRILPK